MVMQHENKIRLVNPSGNHQARGGVYLGQVANGVYIIFHKY